MNKIGFKTDEIWDKFITNLSNSWDIIKWAPLNNDLRVVWFNCVVQWISFAQLGIYSRDNTYKWADEVSETFTEIVRLAIAEQWWKVSRVLGYICHWGLSNLPIEEYAHRPLEVSSALSGAGWWLFLHNTLDGIVWENKKEVLTSTQLLHFYMKLGFSITAVHLIMQWKKSQKYELGEEQIGIIESLIHKYKWEWKKHLPFFVEVQKKGKGSIKNKVHSAISIPSALIKFTEQWAWSYHICDPHHQEAFEVAMWFREALVKEKRWFFSWLKR